jgi:hypothetical protein
VPRYFFNIHGIRPSIDEEGEELPDDEVAWHEATVIAGEIFRDIDGKFRPEQEWSLEVTDERRQPLYKSALTQSNRSKAASVGGLFHSNVMSLVGTNRTKRAGLTKSVVRGRPEVAATRPKCRD